MLKGVSSQECDALISRLKNQEKHENFLLSESETSEGCYRTNGRDIESSQAVQVNEKPTPWWWLSVEPMIVRVNLDVHTFKADWVTSRSHNRSKVESKSASVKRIHFPTHKYCMTFPRLLREYMK